jgi:hypothetical protein
MTGGERIRYLRQLSQTYAQLKADWMDLVLQVKLTKDDIRSDMIQPHKSRSLSEISGRVEEK